MFLQLREAICQNRTNKITIYKFPEDTSFNVVIIVSVFENLIFCGLQLKVLKIEINLICIALNVLL